MDAQDAPQLILIVLMGKCSSEGKQTNTGQIRKANKMIKKLFKKLIKRFFDYEIVGEYLDKVGENRYKVKYIKKYHLKGRKAVRNAKGRRG